MGIKGIIGFWARTSAITSPPKSAIQFLQCTCKSSVYLDVLKIGEKLYWNNKHGSQFEFAQPICGVECIKNRQVGRLVWALPIGVVNDTGRTMCSTCQTEYYGFRRRKIWDEQKWMYMKWASLINLSWKLWKCLCKPNGTKKKFCRISETLIFLVLMYIRGCLKITYKLLGVCKADLDMPKNFQKRQTSRCYTA